jgi:adenylate kinase family enzyme
MASRLIIIRGNSGSGKTTIAKRLQHELGYGTMLVSQDVLRREILRVKDGPDNPSIQLIYDTVLYGNRIGYDVILEGILATKHYGKMLNELLRNFDGDTFAYYFDLPFEETLKRHKTKPNTNDYGEAEMKQWWNDKDYLAIKQEKHFDHKQSEDQIVQTILEDIREKGSRPAS